MIEPTALLAEIPSRKTVVARQKEHGGRVAAVFPIHYSRGLLRAFDVLPIEVWGPPHTQTTLGDAHLQAYTCSIVRGGLSFLLSGGLDVADIILVPHACDSLQGLGSLLTNFVDAKRPVLTLYFPRGPEASSIAFLASELRRLYERLAEITGQRPDDAALLAAEEREEAADALLGRLLASRRSVDVSDRDFYRFVRAREFLPAEAFSKLIGEVLAGLNGQERAGKGILLSGIVPEPMDLLDTLSAAGAVVVADDFACAGRRLYPAGTSRDPYQRMAERLVGGPPDSTRGSELALRVEHLARLAREHGAETLLFYVVKFCEPELFYLPQMRDELKKRGLSSVVIEGDVTESLPHQAVTRVEAMMETLS
jgi:benzoyl-CoA reductase/2-hydroxyglutaryl-CoA dehydratase subunit BcrC/BadD/HgdB